MSAAPMDRAGDPDISRLWSEHRACTYCGETDVTLVFLWGYPYCLSTKGCYERAIEVHQAQKQAFEAAFPDARAILASEASGDMHPTSRVEQQLRGAGWRGVPASARDALGSYRARTASRGLLTGSAGRSGLSGVPASAALVGRRLATLARGLASVWAVDHD